MNCVMLCLRFELASPIVFFFEIAPVAPGGPVLPDISSVKFVPGWVFRLKGSMLFAEVTLRCVFAIFVYRCKLWPGA